jgi:signal transduction histidine kinase
MGIIGQQGADVMKESVLRRPVLLRSRFFPVAVVALTLAIFAAMLGFVNLRLRANLRTQIAGRDAQVLHTVALLQGLAEAQEASPPPDEEAETDLVSADLAALLKSEQLKAAVARLKGVIGARFFDAKGNLLIALPPSLVEAPVPAEDWKKLHQLQPVSRYHRAVRRNQLFVEVQPGAPEQPSGRAVLEALIPLAQTGTKELLGVTQLLLDGDNIAAEFATLDWQLLRQGLGVFLGGGVVIVVGLTWALRRLQQVNELLSERTDRLLQANAELALAARTSAVGAVTAHLVHGLKNPLSGLQTFVASQRQAKGAEGEPEWAEAASTARRMQTTIQEIVRVLREESGLSQYELTANELLEVVRSKSERMAQQAGVCLQVAGTATGTFTNRAANLMMLILDNLISNAIQATPAQKTVRLEVSSDASHVEFSVHDQGRGFPEAFRAQPFAPVRSTKPGGSGIGLAISKQLANHLGAELELQDSSAQGCAFVLRVPIAVSRSAGSPGAAPG